MKNNLKKYREELGHSQIEFAKILSVKQAYLSKLENNHIKEIPAEILNCLRKIDVNVDLLYIIGIHKEVESNKSAELVRLNKALKSNAKEIDRLSKRNSFQINLIETLTLVVREKYNSLNKKNHSLVSISSYSDLLKTNSEFIESEYSGIESEVHSSNVFSDILVEYPNIFHLKGNNYSENESMNIILNYESEGSDGQKAYFNLIEKYAAIKKLFVLGLREAAVEASIKDVFEEAITQRDYHLCQDIARLLYLHFKLYEDSETALKYKNLRDTFSNLLKLEYETEDVYFELVIGQQLPFEIDKQDIGQRLDAIKGNLEVIKENFNYESSIYKYYYFLGKCLMGKTDEESLEFILEGLQYFENLYFKHEAYINTFRFYHAYYFFRKELFDICLSTAEKYFKDVKIGGPAWHKYLDLIAKCHLGQDELKEARKIAETSKNHESFKSLPKVNQQRTLTLIAQIGKKEEKTKLNK